MQRPEIPNNEQQRLQAVNSYQILDTLNDQAYNDITLLASEICQTPISFISIIDENRQWFKAKVGLEATETSRDVAFCAHAINKADEILIVPDARLDDRFHDNPLVTGNPNIVFYAGVPLVDEDGFALGTLCAIDTKPNKLNEQQLRALKILAKNVIDLLNVEKKNIALIKSEKQLLESINFNCPYFLLINGDNEILELGDNYVKSINGITKNKHFSDFFIWESHFSASGFLSERQTYNKLLFFNSVDGEQKFKCSVKKYNNNSYFIFANAVINSKFLIADYHLKITDFPKQDYIAEFLFLQQAATTGLEDSKKLIKALTEKNKELEISKNALINSNSILEHQVNERTKKIKNLALFPEQNPNPLLELDYEKKEIVYLNPVAKERAEKYNLATFTDICNNFNLTDDVIKSKQNKKYEFNFNDKIFDTSVYFLETGPTVRLYLHDITEIRLKEKLEKTKQERFIEQQKTLLDLRNLSKELTFDEKLEIIYRKTSAILKCDRCSVWLFNEEKNAIHATSIYLKQTDAVVDGMTLYAKDFPNYFLALNKAEVIAAADAETHQATAEFTAPYLKPLNIVSMLDIPIIKSNSSIGVICNEYIETKHEFTEGDISFANSIADIIILSLEAEKLKNYQKKLIDQNKSINESYHSLVMLQEKLVEQEKLATLGMLIAGIAHEINTPLGAIKASNEILSDILLIDLFTVIKKISSEELQLSIKLFSLYKPLNILSTKKEREIIQNINLEISKKIPIIEEQHFYSRAILELGYTEIENSLIPFLQLPNNKKIFLFTLGITRLIKSTKTIAIAVEKAAKVVKALNNFSNGSIETNPANFSLKESIDSAVLILWNRIKTGAIVNVNIDSQIFILGSESELCQVWTNIISNALQASDHKCTIDVSYSIQEKKHIITFSNNGPPIPEHILPRIFEAFYTTKKIGEGSGLGLNISKKIIEKHNGSIFCKSQVSETSFEIQIPIN